MKQLIICIFALFFVFGGSASASPSRIISASPCFTEILFALNLESKVVGITRYCDNIKGAEKKEIVGDMNLNMEKVLSLKPDLVIAMPNGRGDNIRRLEAKGLKVLSMRCDTIGDFRSCVIKIGKEAGNYKKAEALLKELDGKFAALKSKTSKIRHSDRKRVFVEIWDSPLMTTGRKCHLSEMISIAGGRNAGDSIDGAFGSVGTEFLYEYGPDVIFLLNSHEIKNNWKPLKAVKSRKVFVLNPDDYARPSFRMPELAGKLYGMMYSDK